MLINLSIIQIISSSQRTPFGLYSSSICKNWLTQPIGLSKTGASCIYKLRPFPILIKSKVLITVFCSVFLFYIVVKVEHPSYKWSNSFSCISWVTYGNREEECHGSAFRWLIPYQLPYNNALIQPINFSMLIVFFSSNQQK